MKIKFKVNDQTFETGIGDSDSINIDMNATFGSGFPFGNNKDSKSLFHSTKGTSVIHTSINGHEQTIIQDGNGKVIKVVDGEQTEEFSPPKQPKQTFFQKFREKKEKAEDEIPEEPTRDSHRILLLLLLITASLLFLFVFTAFFYPETLNAFFDRLRSK